MKEPGNIRQVAALQPDFMGFIFYEKSKRCISEIPDDHTFSKLENIYKTGVFVNAGKTFITDKIKEYRLDYVQLHGNETAEFCRELAEQGVKIIKAFQADYCFDFSVLAPYENYCSYFLFDTKTEGYGGSGRKFNWELLKGYEGKVPLFLSGGIGAGDAAAINNLKNEKIEVIDINSGFEAAPGIKDANLIKEFKDEIQH